jgi:ribosomal protein S18 acetylase RimI-like enzyme
MESILDNPIWHGLRTGNEKLSKGNGEAKFFSPNVSASAGLRENNEGNLELLYQLLPAKRMVTLFSDSILQIPEKWLTTDNRTLFQMVYTGKEHAVNSVYEVKSLNEKHIPAMMELAKISKPGAFFERTIDFGNYKGIFSRDQLIAMAGYRFQPYPYIEISAVCTHPDHLRKGYAGLIINNLIYDITRQSRIPYLHVWAKNKNAILLYEKLGFETRRELNLYTMLKQ